MLSNTATPKYYGEYREKVLRGEIVVNRWVSLEMNRIDNLIADPSIYYDPEPVERWIAFCENECTLTDGNDLHLLDIFKVFGEQVFCWYYFVRRTVYVKNPDGKGGTYKNKTIKKRLINKQYIIMGRGGAKSMFLSNMQNYFLNADTTTTHQITTAPTMKLAEEVLSPIRTAIIRSPGPLFKFLTKGSLQNTTGSRADRIKLCSTKKGIENFMTGSLLEIRPMSIDKLQGLRTKIATVDEWLSGDTREDPIGAIEQGASKLDDYLIIAASSEGTVRNGPGDTIKMELMSILKGDYINPHVSIWYFCLDDVSEVANPEMWEKANPNLGITVTYETYQLDVERAEKAPSTRNDILAKRFGLAMEGYTYFFTYEQTLLSNPQDFWGAPCAMGADMSQGDDFEAFTFLFPLPSGKFGVKTRCYITSKTYNNLAPAMRNKYDEFIAEGSLIIMEGTILDTDQVYDDLDAFLELTQYDVCAFGYDIYGIAHFLERWETERGAYADMKVIQGYKTETVPLGEIRHLAEERELIFDQEIMKFTMGNCIVMEDNNGNRKLMKRRRSDKIDSVAALMDAFVAYKTFKDQFE